MLELIKLEKGICANIKRQISDVERSAIKDVLLTVEHDTDWRKTKRNIRKAMKVVREKEILK